MRTNFLKSVISLFLLWILLGACSKNDKCNVTMLSFNNKLSNKITVRLYSVGEKDIEPGSAVTFKVRPHETYQYDVLDYWSKAVLARSKESVDACVSKGVNIK